MKKLIRSKSDRVLAGVCGGMAAFFGLDSKMLRIIFVLLSVIGVGSPVIFYFIMWLLMPEERESFEDRMNRRLGK